MIILLGLIFDYTNGFHDAANVVSTVIATKVLRPLIAIVMAGVLNTLGATQISGVAETITTGLIEAKAATEPMIISALSGAIAWNLITWYFGIPSSSSYALIGGLLGAALFWGGFDIILWKGGIMKVALPMVISPLLGFFLAFLLMRTLYFFLNHHAKQKSDKLFRILQIGSSGLVALSHV